VIRFGKCSYSLGKTFILQKDAISCKLSEKAEEKPSAFLIN
tara:strand:- start:1273 stop:1395 length:123 start_codon:yes stop_codon:yes gene_type:complete